MSKILIIGYVWPEPASSAAGRHMMDIILAFHQAGWDVTFATPAAVSQNRFDLAVMGITEKSIELNAGSFDRWLSHLQPDVVVFDRFMMEEQFGWRVSKTCPEALLVLDTEDLHFLRQARQKQVSCGNDLADMEVRSDNALREIASIYRCDLTLIISNEEMALLQNRFLINSRLLHYYPMLVHGLPEQLNGFDQRRDFIFVGTMKHAPNLDAVRRLKKNLWPKIQQQLPGAGLYIVGSYMTGEVFQMHNPAQGIHVLGHVSALGELLEQKRVTLVPLNFGAGIKGKLIEAMQYGLPSVTTAIGAEGITDHASWPGVIADSDQAFIDAAVSLYRDKHAWESAQQQGIGILKSGFLYDDYARSLVKRVEVIQAGLAEHRKENFIGQMLRLNNMKSTEYMSRWIECKNKNSRDSGSFEAD